MKSPKFSGKPKRPRLLIRRVIGDSMRPVLQPGSIVVAVGLRRPIRSGDVVIVCHGGLEKVKRVLEVHDQHVYLTGDNAAASTDSRTFGWLHVSAIAGRVV